MFHPSQALLVRSLPSNNTFFFGGGGGAKASDCLSG